MSKNNDYNFKRFIAIPTIRTNSPANEDTSTIKHHSNFPRIIKTKSTPHLKIQDKEYDFAGTKYIYHANNIELTTKLHSKKHLLSMDVADSHPMLTPTTQKRFHIPINRTKSNPNLEITFQNPKLIKTLEPAVADQIQTTIESFVKKWTCKISDQDTLSSDTIIIEELFNQFKTNNFFIETDFEIGNIYQKILLRQLPVNHYRITKNPEVKRCSHCRQSDVNNVETLEHVIWNCKVATEFWKFISTFINIIISSDCKSDDDCSNPSESTPGSSKLSDNDNITLKDIVYMFPDAFFVDERTENNSKFYVVFKLHSLALSILWRIRNEKVDPIEIGKGIFMAKLRHLILNEQYVFCSVTFNNRWSGFKYLLE